MNLFKFSVDRPITVVMVTLIVVIIGAVSLFNLPLDLLPEIELPIAVATTSYDGVGPTEIEELVTKPLENSLATVSNIKKVSSISSEGNSVVLAEFTQGTDMDFAALEMREKIDLVKGILPEDSGNPLVIRVDPNATPILEFAVTQSGEEDLAFLKDISEDTIAPRLERLKGVASVSVSGGEEDVVEVLLSKEKLRGYEVTTDTISQVLKSQNLTLPGGEVKRGTNNITVKTSGKITSLEELKETLIPLQGGGAVSLRDLGEVKIVNKEAESISKIDGKRSVNISIQKQSGTNTVTVSKEVKKEIEDLKRELSEVEIVSVMDQSLYIKGAVGNVATGALVGGILAVVILYLFLKNLKTTLVIAVSIPVSIIATFTLIYFNGITLNLMTLGGLALGVGMLVDNSIVVLENIYRFRQLGFSKRDAAIDGTKEVALAITASTLTTIAVFLPIAFVEGITSIIFKEFALTVTMSLGASLLVSLTVVPMLSSRLISTSADSSSKGILFKIDNYYKRALSLSMSNRKITLVVAFLVFIISVSLIPTIGFEFFPTSDQGTISVRVELPKGASLKDTDAAVSEIEEEIREISEVRDTASSIGSNGSQMSFSSSSTNSGTVQVNLKPLRDRKLSDREVGEKIRLKTKDIAGVKTSVDVASSAVGGLAGSNPIDLKIKGDNIDSLREIGKDIEAIVKGVEGTREVKSSLREGVPEVDVRVDNIMATRYGVNTLQISSAVRNALSGQVATRYSIGGREIDVLLREDSNYKDSLSNLSQAPVFSQTVTEVPLGEVADFNLIKGPVSINREEQVRTISVTGDITDRDIGSVNRDIERELKKYKMPKGYSYEVSGENEQAIEAFENLGLALLLAVVLVYMVLASQFESLLYPFIIMFSVPLAIGGGVLGLVITRRNLSVVAFIGFIMLAGIVVNNAIVLVDYINTRRRDGEERLEAILNAGPIRLRPILMTTLTTVLGLIPLALGIGDGGEIQAPMATVVVGGLVLSTLLTLLFIPVLYTLLDDVSNRIR